MSYLRTDPNSMWAASEAASPDTPPDLLSFALLESRNPRVRAAAAGNTKTPSEALAHALRRDTDAATRLAAARNRSTPSRALFEACSGGSPAAAYAAARNPSLTGVDLAGACALPGRVGAAARARTDVPTSLEPIEPDSALRRLLATDYRWKHTKRAPYTQRAAAAVAEWCAVGEAQAAALVEAWVAEGALLLRGRARWVNNPARGEK